MRILKSKKALLGIMITLVMMLSIYGIQRINDINKAKISTLLLGLHKDNDPKFLEARSLILNQSFQKCLVLDSIKQWNKKLIEDYVNKKYQNFEVKNQTKIDDIYARDEKEWNSGCSFSGEFPTSKFEYILYSKDAMIICSLAGGIASSYWFEFFRIEPEGLEEVALINTSTRSLFDMVLFFRFDNELIEWNEENNKSQIGLK